jgi:hypothetical protein
MAHQQAKVESFISLQALDPVSLAPLLLDSITYATISCEAESFDLALDICLKTIQMIRHAKQEYLAQKESKRTSTTCLTSLSNDLILDICSYVGSKSKCKFRFTSNYIHCAMMRCPLDLSKDEDEQDAEYVHEDLDLFHVRATIGQHQTDGSTKTMENFKPKYMLL